MMAVAEDIHCLKRQFPALPEAQVKPIFIVVSGLPGTGKSYFCRKLAERIQAVIVESDAMRKALFANPNYTIEESARLFTACHGLIEEFLLGGVPVIFDATNLSEKNRERLYHFGSKAGARIMLVSVEAPPGLVYQRLKARKAGMGGPDNSDADLQVYQRMKTEVSQIRRNHLVVDTSRDIIPAIDKIVRTLSR